MMLPRKYKPATYITTGLEIINFCHNQMGFSQLYQVLTLCLGLNKISIFQVNIITYKSKLIHA